MTEELAGNMGFIMGNKHRERIIQVLGSKGAMKAERIAKVGRIPEASVRRILAELAERGLICEDADLWSLTGSGLQIEREMKRRA
ncbi:MAG: transcriptional regulator [Methanothrix sp.]|nr:transcriptional regulator [Methanothrix sp.]